jgi:hypothetical protein
VLLKAGGGEWFDVAERADLQPLLQERQIIQNTRTALQGKNAQSLPPLRFAGVILDGGVVGYDTNETTGGAGANYLGVGANVQYRQDIITIALRAVSVQTGRVLASVTSLLGNRSRLLCCTIAGRRRSVLLIAGHGRTRTATRDIGRPRASFRSSGLHLSGIDAATRGHVPLRLLDAGFGGKA